MTNCSTFSWIVTEASILGQILGHQISLKCESISPSDSKCAHLETFAISMSLYVSM